MTMRQPLDPGAPPLDGRVEDAFLRHRGALLGMARLLCGDGGRAEEIVQEVFVTFHRRHASVAIGSELAYLRRAVANQAAKAWRSRSSQRRHLHVVAGPSVDTVTPEALSVAGDRRRRVDAALSALPERQRQCAVLTYFSELSVAEVAATLEIGEGSVKTHLHRARAALALSLKDL